MRLPLPRQERNEQTVIRIITDTSSEITLSEARKLDIELIEQPVSFGPDNPYDQLADPGFEEFYERLEASRELPVTSAPSPGDFLDSFERAAELGDDVIAIILSAQSSGTYNIAQMAREMSGYENIFVIDSKLASIGQRLLVEYAVALRAEGRSAGEIRDLITGASGRVRLYASLDTLKYLRKGGRISMGAEVLGSMLGIKPIIEMRDGATKMAGKARGHAGLVTTLVKMISEHSGFDSTTPVYFGYTREAQSASNFRRLVSAKFCLRRTVIYPVGATIGAHVGPGGIAIAYLEK